MGVIKNRDESPPTEKGVLIVTKELREFLQEDIEQFQAALSSFEAYEFPHELCARMEMLGLSSSALGERCMVSHTIVDKWRRGKARPNGKERMKELGMALGMNAANLDIFLYRNGYPKLYAKNPLDSAAKLLLLNSAGRADVVDMYRELVGRLGLAHYAPPREALPLKTSVLNAGLVEAAGQGQISGWFRAHEKNFTGDAKTLLPDMRIVRYILLYVGEATIHEMAVTGELPVTLKNLLYPLVGGKAVHVRGLREKLIAFGLYANMTEDEIDVLMDCAKLRPVSEPVSRADMAVLSALREAHERYPLYESENLERIVRQLSSYKELYDQTLLAQYEPRLINARERAAYYEANAKDSDAMLFEKRYTAYCDRGVMDYVRDVLAILCEEKELTENEVKPVAELIQRTDAGLSIWNTKGEGPWN